MRKGATPGEVFLNAILADRTVMAVTRRRPAPRAPSNKPKKRDAQVRILASWRAWAHTNAVQTPPADPDIHAFLAHVRATEPVLLKFISKPTPYETAFHWVAGAGK
jgi:hypothetical protein